MTSTHRHGWGVQEADEPPAGHAVASARHTNDGRSSDSVHSLFADDLDDNELTGPLGNRAAEQKILDNANFGLAKLQLRSGKSNTRRTSANVITNAHRLIHRNSSDLIPHNKWREWLVQLSLALCFLDSIYILFSAPFRLGFFFDPWASHFRRTQWTTALTAFTVLDIGGGILRIFWSHKEAYPLLQRAMRSALGCCNRRVRQADRPRYFSMIRASFIGEASHVLSLRSHASVASARGDHVSAADTLPFRHRSKSAANRHAVLLFVATLLNCFPTEFIIIIFVQDFNLLHLVGFTRFLQAAVNLPRHFSDVVLARNRHRGAVQALSFGTIAAIVYLFLSGIYWIHFAASGYMFMAHWQCGLSFDQCPSSLEQPGSWVHRDRLDHGAFERKFSRALYWASKTVTTLGQGDLVPATEAETVYRVLVQFVSGLWATAILTAYSFYFSRKDAKMATNLSTRLEQATMFLSTRRLPAALVARVRTYFHYMQRSRFGVEEDLTLKGLPLHYHAQCLNYVKYKSFQRLTMFKTQDGAFLRTILHNLEKDYFAPGQVVLAIGDVEEMFVVASGEINIVNANNSTLGRLVPGNAHAERALFTISLLSEHTLIAETHCEVWVLHHDAFIAAMKKHFSRFKYASMVAPNALKAATSPDNSRLSSPTGDLARGMATKRMPMSKLVRKVSADLGMIASASAGRKRETRTVVTWQMPKSKFRHYWSHAKGLLLLFQLYEVPYHIAFQRGFGLFNPSDSPLVGATPMVAQQMDFVVTCLVEIFFYVDWFFRARRFYRFASSGNTLTEMSESSANFALLKEPAIIFRYYRENDNVFLDLLLHAPFPIAWDGIPKHTLNDTIISVGRFIRLLRLGRLVAFRQLLRELMIAHALSPSKRMLVYVVIFCTASAHFAACLYFLAGDQRHFFGGLPQGGIPFESMSAFDCLQDATLYRNCTWYIYDRSAFNIDAPFLRSLQWSIVLLSTVGYGEIMSFSTRESMIGCIWIFLGANICYCTGCVLSSILGQLDILHTVQQEHVEEINLALMNAPNLSEETKTTIRSYYDTKWQLNGSASQDTEVLKHLPRSIRQQLRVALHAQDLQRCYLFATESKSQTRFVGELARIARCEIFLRDVMVVREGHLATEFFVIQTGEVELLLPPLKAPSVPVPIHAHGSDRVPRISMVQSYKQLGQRLAMWKVASTHDLDTSVSFKRTNTAPTLPRLVADQVGPPRDATQPMIHARAISRAVTLPSLDRRLTKLGRPSTVAGRLPCGKDEIPILILKQHDCFGEESLTPPGQAKNYQVSVRVVASAQVTVISRRDLLHLSKRFTAEFERISMLLGKKAGQDDVMLRALHHNFTVKPKIARRLGIPQSLYVDRSKLDASQRTRFFRVIDPEEPTARWWYRVVGVILVYNFYAVIFRIAFLPTPSESTMTMLTAIDYVCDVVLYVDIALKYGWMGYEEHGHKCMDPVMIRKRYVATWLKQDCWSMLPTIFYRGNYEIMTFCRLPRILRSPQLMQILDGIQVQIQERFLRGNNTKILGVFDLFRFALIFVSTAHYIGSLYYLLGRLQLASGLVERSWISADTILDLYPDNIAVHYMRSLYWCLSTFTVDCFGDILARNFLETLFSMCTCVLGWIFIGQVIGRINVLMMSLDKEAKQQAGRIFDFDQYVKQRKLPVKLHHQALQSLYFKSECLLDLRQKEIFRDLPQGLQIHLFYEMYSPLLTRLHELQRLSKGKIEAIACALYVEIYVPGDVIFDAGRVGTTLYLLKQGCVELFSPHSHVVFAAIEDGGLFGQCAFFIRGSKRLVSARAVRSCQVLQLDRRRWDRLWPYDMRKEVEEAVLPIVHERYRANAKAFFNITKNFFLKNENAKPPLSYSQRVRQRRSPPKLARQASGKNVTAEPPPGEASPRSRRPSMVEKVFHNPLLSIASPAVAPQSQVPPTRLSERAGSQRSIDDGGTGTVSNAGSDTSSASLSCIQSKGANDPATRLSISSATSDAPRRKSSLTAFAEVLGLRDQTKPSVTKLPPRVVVPSERFQLVRRESKRNYGLPQLSAATELKWRRHAKKLAAVRMFEASIVRVETELDPNSGGRNRRASISVSPSVADERVASKASVRESAFPRRFSIGLAERDLREERQAFDPFQLDDMQTSPAIDDLDNDLDDPDNEEDAPHKSRHRRRSVESSEGSFSVTALVRELVGLSRMHRRGRGVKVAPGSFKSTAASNQIWVPPPPGPDMFREGSRFRQTWDVLMLAVTIFYGVVVPFRACFLHEHMDDPKFHTAVVVTFLLEYLFTDLLCMLDFMLHRQHFEFSQHGEVISARDRIATHYWENGSYVADLLSILPLEAIAIGSLYLPVQPHFSPGSFTPEGVHPIWRTLAFARVNRTLRALVHLHRLSNRVQRYVLCDLKLSWLRPGVCYLIRLALDFFLGTHWIACVFFGASYLFYAEGAPSWLTTPGMLVFDDSCQSLHDVYYVPVTTKYLRSFHFSIGAVTTVCYGDILPMNAMENTVTIVVIFLSVGLFSMLSGGFFKVFEMELGKRADYEEKVSQVGQLMVFHQFPSKMWKQMQVYFALSWQESKGMHEEEMLRGLTTMMRYEIANHVHANLLKHVKLLSTCDPHFARALVAVLHHELYVRNDVIIQRGDRGRTMYIIESGLVSIRRPESKRKLSASRTRTKDKVDMVQLPSHITDQPKVDDALTNHRTSRLGSAAAMRLRSNKELLREVRAAAAAAANSPASVVPNAPMERAGMSNVPSSPSEDTMWQALQSSTRDQHDVSPTRKVQVAPRRASTDSIGSVASLALPVVGTSPRPVSIAAAGVQDGSIKGGGSATDIKFVKGPFDYFGERSLLFGTPRMATCVALCVCSLYALTLDKYNKLLDEFPHYRRRNIQDWVMTGANSRPKLSPMPSAAKNAATSSATKVSRA